MINGSPREFIDGLYYGDERFFLYEGKKHFIQGYFENGKPMLELFIIEDSNQNFHWKAISANDNYPVEEFETATIFGSKTFWEVESEIEWVDD